MNSRFLKLLNVYPEEAGITRKLFVFQFFLIAGASFLFVTANALFLSEFPIRQLPVAFFITGIFLFLFNKVYHKAEHLLSHRTLLQWVLIFSIVVTALIGVFSEHNSAPWVPYLLLVWYNIIYLLTGMIFWGLAATVFDVRQSRRIFPIIGAGDIPAKILGYLSVSLLAPYIGLTNMIWITIALFICAFWVSGNIYNTESARHLTHRHHTTDRHTATAALKKDPGNGLINAIALLSFISFAALILIDFIFLAEVKTKYHTDIELAYFLGLFFAGGRILAIFIKFLLSSRFINYAGLVRSLLLSPVSLVVFVVFIFFTQFYLSEFRYLIYLYGIMALITEILKATIQEPVFLILFQPLKLPLRLKGHVFAKGYMLAAALTIMGGALYLFLSSQKMANGFTLLFILLALLVIWIASVFLVKRKYIHNLNTALQRGYISGNTLFLEDQATINLLVKKAGSNRPAEVVFALDLLEKAGYNQMEELYKSVLDRKNIILTNFILERIRQHEDRHLLPYLLEGLKRENDPKISAQYIQTIARVDADNPVLFQYAESPVPECSNAAIEGLLLSDGEKAASIGKEKVMQLFQSKNPADRASAATIIGNVELPELLSELSTLVDDPDIKVGKAAIEAVGKSHAAGMIALIISKLGDTQLGKQAATSLTEMKDEAIAFFEESKDKSKLPLFIRIAGNILTERSTRYLKGLLFTERDYFTRLTRELRKRHYVAPLSEKESFIGLIKDNINVAEEITRMKAAFYGLDHSNACREALEQEIQERIQNVLRLLVMVYPQDRVREAVRVLLKKHNQSSNALEMLELSIPREIFQHLNKMIEHKEKYQPTTSKRDISGVLHRIIKAEPIGFNDWTRAMALRFPVSEKILGMEAFLTKKQNNFSPILKEASAPLLQE